MTVNNTTHIKIKPDFESNDFWEPYSSDLMVEFQQALDEGLDIEKYKDVFTCVSMLAKGETKTNLSNVLYDVVLNAKKNPEYKYIEPSTLEEIKELRKFHSFKENGFDASSLKNKIHGAWMGRVCGCLLGKPLEGIRTNELIPLLKETGNYPMHRYVLSTDITEEMCDKYSFHLRNKAYADTVDGMPVDDDTNYVVLAQKIIEDYGRDFSPKNVSKAWIKYQSIESYFTAEKVAFLNFLNGYEPPKSAIYKNPYREWIGAQIRGDYFGYINPGKPELAAEMAFRDASISHVKNGIYGEMFVSAMIACAAVTDNIEDIILGGLAQIPHTSRLHEAIINVLNDYKNGVSLDDCRKKIHSKFDEHSGYGWCHTISNAMIVAAALLYGNGDFGESLCIAVQTGFDTDCNGATVGSIMGMRNGIKNIDDVWTKPVNDKIHTSIFGVDTVKISDCVEKTLKQLI
ncbi:MAG: ADP-ribosylglycohydrolase family protein [Clostridia bacterium]|nr:ADP-ribosylglycohydrolase family protein [Clostridia bacterium]MBQ7046508.1 ADP-ribosylglycohydrolase family protein [Oscillospiraceae bacterium]